MRARNRWAIGQVVMSGHRHAVIVRPLGRLLAMDVLHDPGLLRSAAWLEAELQQLEASAEELQLAALLIDSASGPVDWQQFRDDTPDKLASLVAAKVAGQEVVACHEEPVQVIQLLDALKQSVAQAQTTPPSPSRLRAMVHGDGGRHDRALIADAGRAGPAVRLPGPSVRSEMGRRTGTGGHRAERFRVWGRGLADYTSAIRNWTALRSLPAARCWTVNWSPCALAAPSSAS